jgi:parallel beta-helix repeat protein
LWCCLLAALLTCATASASTRVKLSAFPGVQQGSVVVFRIHGLGRHSIQWGRMSLNGHGVWVSAHQLKLAARRGFLRVALVRHPSRHVRPVARIALERIRLVVAFGPTPPVARAAVTGPLPSFSSALPAIPADAHYVSPRGDDSNPGTQQQPWKTLDKATSAPQPGDTVVFEAGTYGSRGVRVNWNAGGTSSAPITFIGDPSGQRPRILGYTVMYGAHVRVYNLLFDGPTGRVGPTTSDNPGGEEVMIWTQAADITIASSEIRNSHWHSGIYLTGADGVKLINNYIHNNGDFSDPAQSNLDHGIYWADGSGGLVADNLVSHNLADGVQLYPNATNVTVEDNTIVGNGKSGVIIAQDAARNRVVDNVVANNRDNSIRSWSLNGTGNLVEHNLVWNNGTDGSGNIGTAADGLRMVNNVASAPQFVGGGDFHLLANSPGASWAGAYRGN